MFLKLFLASEYILLAQQLLLLPNYGSDVSDSSVHHPTDSYSWEWRL